MLEFLDPEGRPNLQVGTDSAGLPTILARDGDRQLHIGRASTRLKELSITITGDKSTSQFEDSGFHVLNLEGDPLVSLGTNGQNYSCLFLTARGDKAVAVYSTGDTSAVILGDEWSEKGKMSNLCNAGIVSGVVADEFWVGPHVVDRKLARDPEGDMGESGLKAEHVLGSGTRLKLDAGKEALPLWLYSEPAEESGLLIGSAKEKPSIRIEAHPNGSAVMRTANRDARADWSSDK